MVLRDVLKRTRILFESLKLTSLSRKFPVVSNACYV
jgi:hypothetical protein